MVKKVFSLVVLFFIFGCGQRYTKTGDGRLKAPRPDYKFKNADKFNASIYKQIDTNAYYEMIDVFWSNGKYEKLGSHTYPPSALQFYNNGYLRRVDITKINTDYNYSGHRGVIYLDKNGNLKIDLFQGISQDGSVGIVTYSVKIEGDKIYMLSPRHNFFNGNDRVCYVYEKR
ncbi:MULTISPECIES: hypothetical protein [Epilithonimonas]|uniref:Uncharacterized protein n=1 Tax=Epilithonimonas hispanica TaxID=358687 RepID=A0A3D9CVF0_9FLAO|nr:MULTISPECIES: hypothetical protein [Epilithonimonas]REC69776.1 hypothetical protein DRF58_11855 [Epilithonimonas hispanica]